MPTPAPLPSSPTRERPRCAASACRSRPVSGAQERSKPSSRASSSARSTSGGRCMGMILQRGRAADPRPLRPRPRRRGLAGRLRGSLRGRAALAGRSRAPARGRGRLPRGARRRRRPEHLLHARVRALRRRPLGHRRGRRQPPALRVPLPQSRPRSRGSSRRWTRTRRCRSSIASSSSTTTASTRSRTSSSRRTTSPPGAGGPTRPWQRRSASTRPTSRRTSRTTRGRSRQSGKYELTVWPFHALLGGIGHALVSAVEEAIFFHGDRARRASRASRSRARSR